MALLSLTSASDARAGILAGGASEVTQVLNKVELIMQTKKIVDQVRQTKQTLDLLRNNFKRLNPASWGQFTGALNLLADSVKQGERTAFALARADEEYERRFAAVSGTPERPARFSQAYQGWWTKNRASVRGILAKVGMKASDFRNQQAGLRKLQSLSRSPGSRDQILQAANELAVTQSRQLQELQEIGMQQIALQGTTFTAEQEQIHHEREATRRALKTPRLYRGNEKKY
jgi:P-type conjugative transfer protein TrbJ